jgi:hypothetical protein
MAGRENMAGKLQQVCLSARPRAQPLFLSRGGPGGHPPEKGIGVRGALRYLVISDQSVTFVCHALSCSCMELFLRRQPDASERDGLVLLGLKKGQNSKLVSQEYKIREQQEHGH